MPKISVITVCFNAEEYVEQTIKSVVEQQGCEIEYIVIDGVSTDKTLSIIKRYDSMITLWISEPDDGIADAMNKGIKLAAGSYLLFLHADDFLADCNVISNALCYMENDADIYAFDVIYQTKHKDIRKMTKPFGIRTYFKTPVMHQGVFCKKELFNQIGGFNKSLKVAMDYEFFFRAFQKNAAMKIQHQVLSVMRDTGVSSRQDWPSLKQRFAEEKKVHLENHPSMLMKVIYSVYWTLYLPYRKVRSGVKALLTNGYK
jgi:glycosyltransferase involved in cell wall biosynthesis